MIIIIISIIMIIIKIILLFLFFFNYFYFFKRPPARRLKMVNYVLSGMAHSRGYLEYDSVVDERLLLHLLVLRRPLELTAVFALLFIT